MKQFLGFCLIFLLLTHSCLVSAHAVVTEYSLKIKSVHANTQEKVAINFNSQIETGLSQVFLVRKGDKHELLPIEKGNQQGQLMVTIPPLEAGDYALRLKVFAADGHLTEDLIHFSVSQ